MSAECCGPDEHASEHTEDDEAVRFWQVREIQFATVAGALLLGGFVARWTGFETAEIALHLSGAAVGGWTFVPSTIRSLVKRRIGVGTLMTIALIGALVLGQFAEAAALAFLFSISEALEDLSLTRTRRGLRSLLALVPAETTVLRQGRPTTIPATELLVGDLMLIRGRRTCDQRRCRA